MTKDGVEKEALFEIAVEVDITMHVLFAECIADGLSACPFSAHGHAKHQVDANLDPGPFGTIKPFGEAYHMFSCGGWVTAVAWSPSGRTLAYAGEVGMLLCVTRTPYSCI